ncbi:MAG: hypothetical protein ABSB89_03580 [Candidatus Bathyarchaeia archaeon]|jgi:hypothetical protein
MPYETVKIIKLLSDRPLFGIDLDDDNIWRRFQLYVGNRPDITGTVAELLDRNGQIKRVISKDYTFELDVKQSYLDNGKTCETRTLILPRELVNGYAISEGMPIHLFLNKTIRDTDMEDIFGKETENIFDEIERGTMDVEPKNEKGEILISSDLLVVTKFEEGFYSDLAMETNRAYYYKLPNATLVLLRKIFENLIVDLLQQKFGEEEIDLYYSVKDNRHHSLNRLIPNMRTKFDEFRRYNESFYRDKEDFLRFLGEIRQHGDACAHVFSPFEKDMNRIGVLKPFVNKYCTEILSMIHKIREMQALSG